MHSYRYDPPWGNAATRCTKDILIFSITDNMFNFWVVSHRISNILPKHTFLASRYGQSHVPSNNVPRQINSFALCTEDGSSCTRLQPNLTPLWGSWIWFRSRMPRGWSIAPHFLWPSNSRPTNTQIGHEAFSPCRWSPSTVRSGTRVQLNALPKIFISVNYCLLNASRTPKPFSHWYKISLPLHKRN